LLGVSSFRLELTKDFIENQIQFFYSPIDFGIKLEMFKISP